jgi:hypothetical protein
MAHPVVEFTSADGTQRKFEDSTGSKPPAYEVGERVEVLYRADSPEDAKINSFSSLWLLPLIFGGLGLLIAGIAALLAAFPTHSLALVLAGAALAGLLGTGVYAEPPFDAVCGRVNAVSAPTATANGSITIGSQTIPLRAGDRITTASIGTVGCVNRQMTTSGPVLALVPLPTPLCGQVVSAVPTPGGSTFLELIVEPGFRIAIRLEPSLAGAVSEGSSACLNTSLDAQGNAVALSLFGPVVTLAPSPAVTTTPGATSRPTAVTLPSTAAAPDAATIVAVIGLALVTLAGLGVALLRTRTR